MFDINDVCCAQDFLNGVCTNMIVMQQRQMKYWGGNYDTYRRTREEQDTNQVRVCCGDRPFGVPF